jgi:hypothetical protein
MDGERHAHRACVVSGSGLKRPTISALIALVGELIGP